MISDAIKIFKSFCELIGCPKWFMHRTTFMLFCIAFLITIFKKLYTWISQRIKNRDLHPYFLNEDVKRATKFYIKTKYRKSYSEIISDKEPLKDKNLMSFFLKREFRSDFEKYYLVLAGSGIGKTTFLINLYISYKSIWSSFFLFSKYDIQLIPLGYTKAIEKIRKIENKKNTFLLLDAFDEDIEALKNYQQRLTQILDEVDDFRKIIITCRTQFFPSEMEEPHETGYISFGEGNKQYNFLKLYLSTFDNNDVEKYLKKRFSVFCKEKSYEKAIKIIKRSPTIFARPMLLSYIDEFLISNNDYEFSFQIYEDLIDKWLTRESKKPKIKDIFESKRCFKEMLYNFSKEFAINLYENKNRYGGYFFPKDSTFHKRFSTTESIVWDSFLSEKALKSRSLLNRDAIGNYRFSHKSILEFFLAKVLFSNHIFYKKFNFYGMNTSLLFFMEMTVKTLMEKKGQYSLNNNWGESKPLGSLSIKEIHKIRCLKIEHYDSILPQILESLKELRILILIESYSRNEIIALYRLFSFYREELKILIYHLRLKDWRKEQPDIDDWKTWKPFTVWRKWKSEKKNIKFTELKELINAMDEDVRKEIIEIYKRIAIINKDEKVEISDFIYLILPEDLKEVISRTNEIGGIDLKINEQNLEWIKEHRQLKLNECIKLLSQDEDNQFNKLNNANQAFKNFGSLSNILKNCKVYY